MRPHTTHRAADVIVYSATIMCDPSHRSFRRPKPLPQRRGARPRAGSARRCSAARAQGWRMAGMAAPRRVRRDGGMVWVSAAAGQGRVGGRACAEGPAHLLLGAVGELHRGVIPLVEGVSELAQRLRRRQPPARQVRGSARGAPHRTRVRRGLRADARTRRPASWPFSESFRAFGPPWRRSGSKNAGDRAPNAPAPESEGGGAWNWSIGGGAPGGGPRVPSGCHWPIGPPGGSGIPPGGGTSPNSSPLSGGGGPPASAARRG